MSELRAGNIWSLIVIDRDFSRTISKAYLSMRLGNTKFIGNFDQAIHVYPDNTSISYSIIFEI